MLGIFIIVLSLITVIALIFFVAVIKKPLKKHPVLDQVSKLQQATFTLKSEINKLSGLILTPHGAHDLQNLSTYIDHVKGIIAQHKTILNQFEVAYEPFKSRKEYQHFAEVCEAYHTSQNQLIERSETALHDLPIVASWLDPYKEMCNQIDQFIFLSADDEQIASSQRAKSTQVVQRLQQLRGNVDSSQLRSPILQKLATELQKNLDAIVSSLGEYQRVILEFHEVTDNANHYNQVKSSLDILSYENLLSKDFSFQNLDVAEDAITKLQAETPNDS